MYIIWLFFFFKQKTAYEMRISDWSSDVCSSDLKIGAELLESHHLADAIELDRSVAEAVPFPCGKAHEQAYNNIVRRAVDHFGADALFVGAGGDNVFYLTHSARPLVDRFNTEGWSRGTFTTLHDICTIDRKRTRLNSSQ